MPQPIYTRRPIAPGEIYVAYRIVRNADPDDPAFVDGFRSRAELGLPPRPRMGENDELAEGISAYKTASAAAGTAQKYRAKGRDLGGYVAELRLPEGQGVEVAEWGHQGHLTMWGNPLMLALHVTDIFPVDHPPEVAE